MSAAALCASPVLVVSDYRLFLPCLVPVAYREMDARTLGLVLRGLEIAARVVEVVSDAASGKGTDGKGSFRPGHYGELASVGVVRI